MPYSLIRAANAHPAPTLAVDLPSGLDGTSGEPYDPCVVAERTLTLALPKTGLLRPGARRVVGSLAVADIGMPPEAFAAIGLAIGPVFGRGEVVEVHPDPVVGRSDGGWRCDPDADGERPGTMGVPI